MNVGARCCLCHADNAQWAIDGWLICRECYFQWTKVRQDALLKVAMDFQDAINAAAKEPNA